MKIVQSLYYILCQIEENAISPTIITYLPSLFGSSLLKRIYNILPPKSSMFMGSSVGILLT